MLLKLSFHADSIPSALTIFSTIYNEHLQEVPCCVRMVSESANGDNLVHTSPGTDSSEALNLLMAASLLPKAYRDHIVVVLRPTFDAQIGN